MVINDQTNTNLHGITLANHFQNELGVFAAPGNAPGNALLAPLLANPQVTVTFKNTGVTATNGTNVTINITGMDVPREVVESAIFELSNASNAVAFAQLETNLKNGTLPIRRYGETKANLEAAASWNVAQILNARGGYVPSEFGRKTRDACANYLNVGAFQGFFRLEPHKAVLSPNDDRKFGLPSQEFYAYNGAITLAGANSTLNAALPNITDNRKMPPQRILPANLKGAVGSANDASSINGQQPTKAARYYWVLVDALRVVPANVNLAWAGGGIGEYEFTGAMKAVAPDNPDPWQPKISAWLNNKNQNMYGG